MLDPKTIASIAQAHNSFLGLVRAHLKAQGPHFPIPTHGQNFTPQDPARQGWAPDGTVFWDVQHGGLPTYPR